MEHFKLNQWSVTVNGGEQPLFTSLLCSEEEAMAIAVSMYGPTIIALKDEGSFRQSLTNPQLHIANRNVCADCGAYKSHDENCSVLNARRLIDKIRAEEVK